MFDFLNQMSGDIQPHNQSWPPPNVQAAVQGDRPAQVPYVPVPAAETGYDHARPTGDPRIMTMDGAVIYGAMQGSSGTIIPGTAGSASDFHRDAHFGENQEYASASPRALPDLPAKKDFLGLIGYTEGTDRGAGYNETLGYGKFAGGKTDLTNMSLADIDKLQTKMLQDPKNTLNSSAVGRYQIVQQTLRGLSKQFGLSPDTKFTPELQDKLATALMKRRGNNPSNLRKEWTSLQRVPDDVIQKLYAVTAGE